MFLVAENPDKQTKTYNAKRFSKSSQHLPSPRKNINQQCKNLVKMFPWDIRVSQKCS